MNAKAEPESCEQDPLHYIPKAAHLLIKSIIKLSGFLLLFLLITESYLSHVSCIQPPLLCSHFALSNKLNTCAKSGQSYPEMADVCGGFHCHSIRKLPVLGLIG